MSGKLGLNGPNGTSLSTDQKIHTKNAERSFWTIKEVERCLERHNLKWHDATLSVDVKELRYKRQTSPLSGQPSSKKARLSSIPARCALTIWDSRSSKKEYVAMQTQKCTITTIRGSTQGDLARIEMDPPFALKASELSGEVGKQDSVRSIVSSSYLMQITLYATDVHDTWPPIPLKRPKPPKVSQTFDHGEIVKAPMLLGKWAKLPDCPVTGALLDVSAYQDSKAYKTKLGLEVDVKWRVSPSPLMIQNLRLKRDPSPEARLLTPISEPDIPTPVINVKWCFPDWPHRKEVVSISGYLCLLCSHLNLRSMEAFHFHLINSHDNFKFVLTSEATMVAGRSNIAVKVKMELADDYRIRASNDVMDDREMSWERPRRPFDMDQYLKGNKSWTGGPMKRPSVNSAPRSNPESSSSSRESSRYDRGTMKLFDPALVKDFPLPDRKKHVVPPAPEGIKYFRSVSKRPLKEGELISESDDEMDQDWLQQKHDETIEDFMDITASEKEFIKVYDAHMLVENLSSSLHLADALIRFCREHKPWLSSRDMSLEFYKNATNLLLHGAIKPSVIKSCADIIGKSAKPRDPNNHPEKPTSHVSPTPDSDDESGDMMELDDPDEGDFSHTKGINGIRSRADHSKSDRTSSRKPFLGIGSSSGRKQDHGACLCGKAVTDMKTSIGCCEPHCENPFQHLSCVGLQRRVPDWLCERCKVKETHAQKRQQKSSAHPASQPS